MPASFVRIYREPRRSVIARRTLKIANFRQLVLLLLFLIGALTGSRLSAQSTTSAAADPQIQTAQAQDKSQQKPDRVTTTVVVHGEVKDDYLSDSASGASLDNTPLKE